MGPILAGPGAPPRRAWIVCWFLVVTAWSVALAQEPVAPDGPVCRSRAAGIPADASLGSDGDAESAVLVSALFLGDKDGLARIIRHAVSLDAPVDIYVSPVATRSHAESAVRAEIGPGQPGSDPRPRVRIISDEASDPSAEAECPWTGYHVVMEDALEYPEDYIPQLRSAVDAFARRAIVGYHGFVWNHHFVTGGMPFDKFTWAWPPALENALHADVWAHVLRLGTLAFHAAAAPPGSGVDLTAFATLRSGAEDIAFAAAAHGARVPRVLAMRPQGYLRARPAAPGGAPGELGRDAFPAVPRAAELAATHLALQFSPTLPTVAPTRVPTVHSLPPSLAGASCTSSSTTRGSLTRRAPSPRTSRVPRLVRDEAYRLRN